MKVRCFDLGESGLRTCCYRNNELRYHQNLGESLDQRIDRWIRRMLPTFDQEIEDGFTFSFSLAGLNKLTKDGHLPNDRSAQNIAALFKLPRERVLTLNDGDAHLLASRTYLKVTQFPHVNFCVGTGVGIGVYDETGQRMSEREVRKQLEKDVWELEVTDSVVSEKVVHFALAGRGYKELLEQNTDKAQSNFEVRWQTFLEDQILDVLRPKIVTFTGGVVQFQNLFNPQKTLRECQIQRGPDDAGLLGAKLHAEQT